LFRVPQVRRRVYVVSPCGERAPCPDGACPNERGLCAGEEATFRAISLQGEEYDAVLQPVQPPPSVTLNGASRRFNPKGPRMHLGCSRYMRTNPTRPNPDQPSSSTA
jgi:hypothetical protein